MKHTHHLLWLLALPLWAQAQAPRSFEARVQAAQALEQQPVPREYLEHVLFPAMNTTLSAATRPCVEQPGASTERFILVADIGADGVPKDVEVQPATTTAECFSSAFQALRLAPPPEGLGGVLPIFINAHLGK